MMSENTTLVVSPGNKKLKNSFSGINKGFLLETTDDYIVASAALIFIFVYFQSAHFGLFTLPKCKTTWSLF